MIKKIILSILTLSINLYAMDAPQGASTQEIPAELQLKYGQERDRFRSYKLDEPEAKFLPLLRTQLKKDDVNKYLRNLNIFLNNLIAQHFMLQKASEINYLTQERNRLGIEEEKLLQQMGAITDPKDYTTSILSIPNTQVLNEVMAHHSIMKKTKQQLTPEELQIVFSWEFDDHLDPWLKLLSQHRLALNIAHPILILRQKVFLQLDRQLDNIKTQIGSNFEKLPTIIQRNTQSISDFLEAREKTKKRLAQYYKKEERLQTSLDSLFKDAYEAMSAAGYLYQYTHNWYEQLYKIVRAELKATIDPLMKAEPAKIKEFTKYMGNEFTDVLPDKVFPTVLPPIIDPHQTITLPKLDKERAVAKKIWDEQQKRKEEERKRNNKIKTDADGNYVLEHEDTPTSISIHNPKNNTQEVIFKHEYPNEIDKSGKNIFPINYTNWVKEWFTDPQHALETHGYNDVQSTRYRAGEPSWKPIVLHAFSPLVDDYIKQWGRITTIQNRRNPAQEDILITIPGKIIYPPGSNLQEEAGVFAYIIDSKNGQWYHRMFTTGSLSELTKNLFQKGYFAPEMTGYYDVFFPALPGRKK